MVWYSHLLNFPQFVVIHTVKDFSIVNEEEIDVFLEFSCFYYDPTDVGNLILYRRDVKMNKMIFLLRLVCNLMKLTELTR